MSVHSVHASIFHCWVYQ